MRQNHERSAGAPAGRWYRPNCRRCGRQIAPAYAAASAQDAICANCSPSERARSSGQFAHNPSPFRDLGAP